MLKPLVEYVVDGWLSNRTLRVRREVDKRHQAYHVPNVQSPLATFNHRDQICTVKGHGCVQKQRHDKEEL